MFQAATRLSAVSFLLAAWISALLVNAGQRQLDVQLHETLVIGDRDAPDYYFSDIHSVVVDGNGDIYVADRKRADVRRYSGDGEFVAGWCTRCRGS